MHKEFSLVCLFIDMAARRTRRERLDPPWPGHTSAGGA